jgi:predicted XRE-type DNA-binding protein
VTTGNVLDDLGFAPEEVGILKIKSDIWRAITNRIEVCQYTQTELVRKLKVHQPDVSNILNGKISKFSVAKLINIASRLNLETEVRCTPPKGETRRSTAVGKRKLMHA